MSHVPAAVERNIRSVVEDDVVSVNNAVSFLTEDADWKGYFDDSYTSSLDITPKLK